MLKDLNTLPGREKVSKFEDNVKNVSDEVCVIVGAGFECVI